VSDPLSGHRSKVEAVRSKFLGSLSKENLTYGARLDLWTGGLLELLYI
jgi:hypothetical protein